MKTIQFFNWKLSTIESILDRIKSQGFDSILINPMQPVKDDHIFNWWASYQPLGFRIGNPFGTKEDLRSLCKKANEKGIKIIVEVVCNNVASDNKNESEINENLDYELKRKDFYKSKVKIDDYENRDQAVIRSLSLPTLDLKNKDLEQIVFRYLDELRSCGVKGYLFNGAKHIGLPSDGVNFFKKVKEYAKLYQLETWGEFLGGNLSWRDELTEYVNIYTHFNTRITDTSKKISYIENPDKYINNKYNYDYFNNEYILKKYKDICDSNENVVLYSRPYRYSPYCSNNNGFNISSANEFEYFDNTYLFSKEIKDINTKAIHDESVLAYNKMLEKIRGTH